MSSDLSSLLNEASEFLQKEFDLGIEESELKLYSAENWSRFCGVNGFEAKSEGIYVPKSQTAYAKADSDVLLSNIFHEYFGHGLFCEHSSIGKKLVEIEQEAEDGWEYLREEINPRLQPLSLTTRNIGNYEGFALWLEALLCEETGNSEIWQRKKDKLPQTDVQLFEYFKEAEQKLTRFGFMAQLGFPKEYGRDTVVDVLKHLYGSNFANIDFVVLYGSQKPHSDIDLFIVSENPSHTSFNGWLDVYELNRNEFQYLAEYLDISITDPLFSGELIYGDNSAFEQLKQRIQDKPITPEAVAHNLMRAEGQRRALTQLQNQPREEKICYSYIESYTRMAEELQKGYKRFTRQELYLLSQEHNRSPGRAG